jgi:selenide,water dikinase
MDRQPIWHRVIIFSYLSLGLHHETLSSGGRCPILILALRTGEDGVQSARMIEKQVVLLGAGNAHLVFVRRFTMHPLPGVAVTLVSEKPQVPYSAMVPGCIGGDYRREEITIDLVRLCRGAGVRLIAAPATRIDANLRRVSFADRPEIGYDVLSLGLGSLPKQMHMRSIDWPMRPLDTLMDRIDTLPLAGPFHLAIVGGGASGCELALALRRRFPRPEFRITLYQADARLAPSLAGRTSRLFLQRLAQANISVHLKTGITTDTPPEADTVLWATEAAPSPLLASSGLSLSPGGFLQVGPSLQSLSHPDVFGTGDCVYFPHMPHLPKNGVHAVRQGRILFDNVDRFLREASLRPFRPQWLTLSLLNTADGESILSYGPFALKAGWVRSWKDRIDREWVQRFVPQKMVAAASEDAPLMRCGGCGNKVSGDVLSRVLRRLDIPDDPRVVLGIRAGEDAAVHCFDPAQFGQASLEVQTVDYFKSFVDDPYLFGRIAALNAVSDLYAMNARPFSALAIATLPYARGPVQEAMLYELLSGALASFRSLGVVLTGGHTTEGPELCLGFALTGHAHREKLFTKGGLKPGDALILTKPLGSGALLAAWMRGELPAADYTALLAGLLQPNARAAAVFAEHGVRACTDVTGFGFAGHLLEMLRSSNMSAYVYLKNMPVYSGFDSVVEAGIVSSLHEDNARYGQAITGPTPAWLFDPQTAGGLMAGVPSHRAEEVIAALKESGYEHACIIGEIRPGEARILTAAPETRLQPSA